MRKSNKRSARRPGIKCAPMLVMRGMVNDRLEVRERQAIEALSGGWATMYHFDLIADMQGVLLLGAVCKKEDQHHAIWCRNIFAPVLGSIRRRFESTGKFDCTPEESEILRGFVTRYRDFWIKKPHALYEVACQQLDKYYAQLGKAIDENKRMEAA